MGGVDPKDKLKMGLQVIVGLIPENLPAGRMVLVHPQVAFLLP